MAGPAIDGALKKKIQTILDQASQGSLLASMEECYKVLRDHSLMYQMQVSSKFIGASELNRDGFGVDAGHVHQILDRFWDMGYVPSAGRYICVEIPSGTAGDKTRKFNEDLVAGSNMMFLVVFSHFSSVTCSYIALIFDVMPRSSSCHAHSHVRTVYQCGLNTFIMLVQFILLNTYEFIHMWLNSFCSHTCLQAEGWHRLWTRSNLHQSVVLIATRSCDYSYIKQNMSTKNPLPAENFP